MKRRVIYTLIIIFLIVMLFLLGGPKSTIYLTSENQGENIDLNLEIDDKTIYKDSLVVSLLGTKTFYEYLLTGYHTIKVSSMQANLNIEKKDLL